MSGGFAMAKSVAFIHTVAPLVPVFAELAQRHLPGTDIFNIVDESLLRNTIRQGALSTQTMRRVAGYIWSATDAGAEAVMVTCSSIGPAVDATRPLSPVPLFRVDEAMAEKAIGLGARIGLLATLTTTLEPTRQLIERRAAALGRRAEITHSVCRGAFEALQSGDRERHDALVTTELLALARTVDVIVLAQASMARVADGLAPGALAVPVLSSPELGVRRLAEALAAA
jgi:Asp/Glu/hydantoin racemase